MNRRLADQDGCDYRKRCGLGTLWRNRRRGRAKAMVKTMTEYVAAEKAISFDYDVSLEVVTSDDQKLTLAASGNVELARPDKVHASRSGGFADIETVFDGETLTILGKNIKIYTQVAIPGSIDHLTDELREKYEPAASGRRPADQRFR